MTKQKESVTFVSNNYWTLYKFRYDVIQFLIDKGYLINLIAGKDGYEHKFKNRLIKKFFIPIDKRGINIFKEIKTFTSLYKIYKNLNTKIIFHFTIKPNIYGSLIASFLKMKSISLITGVGYIFTEKNTFLKKIIILLYKISLKNTLQVWFANVHDKKLFLNLNIIKKQETAIVPGAGAIFNKTLKNKNLDNNKLTFMMISRIQKEKGVKEFLDTAAAFKNDLNKNFILIGSVDDRDPNKISSRVLEKYIADKSITHYEYQEGLEGYLNEASCIIHPSYREGLSTILLEAAVLKIPIITTKVPGCIDIVPNETFGLLCMPRSTHSLKSAVEKFSLLSDIDKSSMAEKTYDFVKNNFDRKQIYNKYISVINNI